jgi:hypothetical protein
MLRIVQPTNLNGSPRSQRRERWRSQLGSRSRGAVTSLGLRDVAAHRTTARRDRRTNVTAVRPVQSAFAMRRCLIGYGRNARAATTGGRLRGRTLSMLPMRPCGGRWHRSGVRCTCTPQHDIPCGTVASGGAPRNKIPAGPIMRRPPRWRAHTVRITRSPGIRCA